MANNLKDESKGLVRIVLPLMAKHKVPITPQNYAVWYAYVSGEIDELQKALDTMIQNQAPFTDEINEKLCAKFGFITEVGEIKKLRDELLQVLLAILNDIAEINGETAHYESFLSKSVESLSKEVSVEDLRTIVECIISETKAIVEFGKATQKKIQNITSELTALKKTFEQTRTEALMDFLTGVANRKAFEEELIKLISEAAASAKELCLLVLDIDHFKQFNDQHGHAVGDEVLRFTAQKLKSRVRGNDFVARTGGEEFAILLPETSLAGAEAVAENIRSFFSTATLKTSGGDKKLGRITVSIGGAKYRTGEPAESFVQRADKAMYAAKVSGRNRVVLASDN